MQQKKNHESKKEKQETLILQYGKSGAIKAQELVDESIQESVIQPSVNSAERI